MRDIVDVYESVESDCGSDQYARAVGNNVYVGNNIIMSFDVMADDYAYDHARRYAEQWNKINGN